MHFGIVSNSYPACVIRCVATDIANSCKNEKEGFFVNVTDAITSWLNVME